MRQRSSVPLVQLSRREFVSRAGGLGLTALLDPARSALAQTLSEFPFANGTRQLVRNFPQKGAMLLLRTRPPLLETPFDVFDASDLRRMIGSTCAGTSQIFPRTSTQRYFGSTSVVM